MKFSRKKDSIIFVFLIGLCVFFVRSSFQEPSIDSGVNLSKDALFAKETFLKRAGKADTDIIVFMTSWCGQCKLLISQIQDANLPLITLDIEESTEAAALYNKVITYGPTVVPVSIVKDKYFIGANAQSLLNYVKNHSE